MATLRDLGSDPERGAHRGRDAWPSPHRQLGQNLRDLPFTLTYLFDDDGDARLAGMSGIAAGHPGGPGAAARRRRGGLAGREAARGASRCSSTRRRAVRRICRPATGPSRRRRHWWCRCCSRAAHRAGSWWPALNRYRPLDDGYRGFVALVAGTYRRGDRQRAQLPGPAAAGRGARRAGPRQDHVLLQHQPRVPHAADADPGSGRRAARPASRAGRSDAPRSWMSSAATDYA